MKNKNPHDLKVYADFYIGPGVAQGPDFESWCDCGTRIVSVHAGSLGTITNKYQNTYQKQWACDQ